MKTLRLLSFAAVIAIALAGCAGKDGAPGATGPQGPQGNANVIDHTFPIISTDWSFSLPGYYWVQFIDNDITQSILNTGSVEVFVNYNTGSWNNLPYTEVISPSLTGIWSLNEALNTMQINYTYSDQINHNDPNTEYTASTIYFKIVCIAGPVMKKHPNTNWHNYNEVESIIKQENGIVRNN